MGEVVLRQTRMEREYGEFQAARSAGFLRGTQRKGMPTIYGTKEPGVGAEAVRKAEEIEERARRAAEAG